MSLPQNVITDHGITASNLPYSRYYREIFPIPALITVVTAVLPLSPLQCHPLPPDCLAVKGRIGMEVGSALPLDSRLLARRILCLGRRAIDVYASDILSVIRYH